MVVIRVVAKEGVVALQAELLGRSVQAHVYGQRRLRQLLCIQHASVALRNLVLIHHAVKHHAGHQVGHNPLTGYVLARGELHAADLPGLDVYPGHFGVVPDIPAHVAYALVEGKGYFVAAPRRHPGHLRQIHIGHKGIDGEGYVRRIGRDIRPIALKDVLGLLRQPNHVADLVAGHRYQLHQIAVFEQHLNLGQALRLIVVLGQPVHAVAHHTGHFHDVRHRLS